MVKVLRSTLVHQPIEDVWNILRDFNGHDQWHPAIATSQIERGDAPDRIGCVRKFKLQDGSELREQLLTMSDLEQTYSYCLFETPIPLFNYVSHVRLYPVTDTNETIWEWEGQFDTPAGRQSELSELVGKDIYQAGFEAIKDVLAQQSSSHHGALS